MEENPTFEELTCAVRSCPLANAAAWGEIHRLICHRPAMRVFCQGKPSMRSASRGKGAIESRNWPFTRSHDQTRSTTPRRLKRIPKLTTPAVAESWAICGNSYLLDSRNYTWVRAPQFSNLFSHNWNRHIRPGAKGGGKPDWLRGERFSGIPQQPNLWWGNRGIRHSPRKGCADDNVQWFITCSAFESRISIPKDIYYGKRRA